MSDIQTPNGLEANETLVGATDEIEVYQPASGGVRRNKKAFLDTLKTFFQTIIAGVTGNIVSFSGAGLISDSGVAVADVGTNTTAIGLNTTHRSSDGSDHGFIDQDVKVAAGPTFNGGVQTDGTLLRTKVVPIGDWDMVAAVFAVVNTGIALVNVVNVTAVIITDGSSGSQPISVGVSNNDTTPQGYITSITDTSVTLVRLTGGIFDNVLYDATSFNRGWVKIDYMVP